MTHDEILIRLSWCNMVKLLGVVDSRWELPHAAYIGPQPLSLP